MFTLLIRKMRNTKWMVICLLIGFVMASAMMSTIPIYMNASLQRMLIKDMQAYQLETNEFPGVYSVNKSTTFNNNSSKQKEFLASASKLIEDRINKINIPIENQKTVISDDMIYVQTQSADETVGEFAQSVKMVGMTGIEEHIKITQGEMYKKEPVDGVYEVIANEVALQRSKTVLGGEYTVTSPMIAEGKSIKIKIVGIYEQKYESDSYWSETMEPYNFAFICDYDNMLNNASTTGVINVSKMSWTYAFDYQNMNMSNIDSAVESINSDVEFYKKNSLTFSMPVKDIWGTYVERSARLTKIMWLLQIPVMLMLAFYLFMVSQLNVEQEKNEISIFKSRGASSFQIFRLYAVEVLMLGAVTAILGPLIALLLCKVLGVSNGFLEFVQRPALPVRLSLQAFLYAVLAIAVFFFTTMIPIIPATKISIVEHKQKKSKRKRPFWEKSFFDLILIGVSIYWLYSFNKQQGILISQGIDDTSATVQPIMFVASTAFILGVGLLFVRLYPLLLKLIFKIGKKVWSPAAYISLSGTANSTNGREKFLIMFMILTVALGIFSANTARAINTYMEDKIAYSVGCDIVLEEEWSKGSNSTSTGPNYTGGSTTTTEDEDTTVYIEPEFGRFENLAGVNNVTKVFVKENASVKAPDANNSKTTVMGIVPDEFADIAWFRNDLLPAHINNYINALVECNSGVILSTSYQEKGVKLGDTISVKWSNNEYFDVIVVAFADYWPALNPKQQTDRGDTIDFAVMNYNYLNVQTKQEPYQVWVDLKEGVTSKEFYDEISSSKIKLSNINDKSQMMITQKNDPMLQGMNGALTLGFIIIIIMCIIGFLIYWIMSIKSRTLQFGILRAMGVSFREIIGMLLYEQILVSGVAIVVAVVIGGVTSDLFVPLFQSMFPVSEQIPPFITVAFRSDYIKLYIIIGLMLIFGFGVIGRLISKIKINQALKLGED